MIWGVDIGVRSLHLAGIGDPEVAVQCRSITADKQGRHDELRTLVLLMHAYVREDDVLFIEEPPLAGPRNTRTFMQLAQTCGAVLGSCRTLSAYAIPVGKWKKDVVGNGSASKELVAQWLAKHHPALSADACGDQNLVDAFCLALYGRQVIQAASEAS